MKNRWILAAALAFAATAVLAKNGIVTTQTGQRFEGDVTETESVVIVNMHGVETRIERAEVANVEYLKSWNDEFDAKLAKLAADDAAGRIELARWAVQQQQYTSARDALESALAIDPNSAAATEMLANVRSQMRLQSQARTAADNADAATAAANSDAQPASQRPGLVRKVLDEQQIQAIRRIEMRPTDNNLRVRVDPKIAKQFAERRNTSWQEYSQKSQLEQARDIIGGGSEEELAGVMVLNDPPAISEFRKFVQPVILSGCATSGCHGGPAGGKFLLLNRGDGEAAAYTNFFLLSDYLGTVSVGRPATGIFGGDSDMRLINRGNAKRSLLLQYALPVTVAEFDHPKVQNWTPAFQSLEDPRAKPIVKWIDESLRLNPGSYGFKFSLSPADMESATTRPGRP